MILEIILTVWYFTMCFAMGGIIADLLIWCILRTPVAPYICICNNDKFLAYLFVFLCPFLNIYVYVGGHDIAHFGKGFNIKVN